MRFETLQRFQAAAESERLSDHVRYTRFGEVFWRDPDFQEWEGGQPVPLLLFKAIRGAVGIRWWEAEIPPVYPSRRPTIVRGESREEVIRCGLRAIYEAEWR